MCYRLRAFVTKSLKITDLFICCDSGDSRSPAIGAALLYISGRGDDCIWNNPFYKPNLLVYRVMCTAFGKIVSEGELQEKKQQSDRALPKAIENADASGYKRWEVYECMPRQTDDCYSGGSVSDRFTASFKGSGER